MRYFLVLCSYFSSFQPIQIFPIPVIECAIVHLLPEIYDAGTVNMTRACSYTYQYLN